MGLIINTQIYSPPHPPPLSFGMKDVVYYIYILLHVIYVEVGALHR